MRRSAIFAFIAGTGVATSAMAQSPFDGTWQIEKSTENFAPRTFDISLQNGVYACSSCRPAWSVAADGAFYSVSGHLDFEETSVQVVDDRTVIFTRRKAGRGVYQAIDSISADGNFLVFAVTEFSGAGKPISTTGSWVRATPRPAGSHSITGKWRELRPDVMSDNVSTFTVQTGGDILRLTFGTGEVVTARFGGPPAKVDGDPNGTLVSYRKIGETAFEETEMRDGEDAVVRTYTVVDPSTMKIARQNKRSGKVGEQIARKR